MVYQPCTANFAYMGMIGVTQQKRTCKIMQESCMQDLHGTCTRYVPFLARFLHNLARSCTYFARNGARFCKGCCKNNNYLQVWSFLHHFLQDLARYVQDCARIVQEKGHITCTFHASLACKILAQSCMILQVRFCWEAIGFKIYPRLTKGHIQGF